MRVTRTLRLECGASLSCPAIIGTDDPHRVLVQGPTADPALRDQLGVPDHEGLIEMPSTMLAGVIGDAPPLLTLEQLGAYVARHRQGELFRLETLPYYAAESDAPEYRAWLRGEPGPDLDGKRDWLQGIADDTDAGRPWRRVRIVRGPLSEYEQYEMAWCYGPNAAAGEQIRVLDLAEVPLSLPEVGDFFVMDGSTAIRMHYDRTGALLGAEIVQSGAAAYVALRALLWHVAEPFGTWWARHPRYARASRAA